MTSEQVACLENREVRIVGEPEYHGNPQNKNGSLVTWRYGYDLPYAEIGDDGGPELLEACEAVQRVTQNQNAPPLAYPV